MFFVDEINTVLCPSIRRGCLRKWTEPGNSLVNKMNKVLPPCTDLQKRLKIVMPRSGLICGFFRRQATKYITYPGVGGGYTSFKCVPYLLFCDTGAGCTTNCTYIAFISPFLRGSN